MRRSKELKRAIVLREWTRTALLQDDLLEVARLNKEADLAYLNLDRDDANAYIVWARS
jgi:hypothetical protein